jgi:hypothetical protein
MRTAVAVAVLAFLAPPAAYAQAPSFVVQADVKIGRFAVKRDRTLGAAQRAFGQPTSVRPTQQAACAAAWAPYGLTIHFYNLGGQNPCTPRYGFFSRAFLQGSRWRTASGLRVGNSVAVLRRLYPAARFYPGVRGERPAGWWLVTRTSPFGLGGSYPGLLATTRNRAVSSFQVRYPAGGD